MERIKKDDIVQVISGANKGKSGAIIDILPKKGKIKVKGVAIVTRHVKARQQGQQSAIRKEESYIDITNVMPICPATKKPCRIRVKTLENGKRVRISSRTNEAF
jgi:large subunit ribosomal protein L24